MKKLEQPELREVKEDLDDALFENEVVAKLEVGNSSEVRNEEGKKSLDNNSPRGIPETEEDNFNKLFAEEEDRNTQSDTHVRKALSIADSKSNVSMRASKSADAINTTRAEEIASYQGIEDSWVETEEEITSGRKRTYLSLLVFSIVSVLAILYFTKGKGVAYEDKEVETQEEVKTTVSNIDIEKAVNSIEKLVSQYVAADNAEEKLALIHEPEKYREDVIAYYADESNTRIHSEVNTGRIQQENVNDTLVWSCLYFYQSILGKKKGILFFHEEDGRMTLDWPSIYGFQTNDVEAFIEAQSSEAIEVRAEVFPYNLDGTFNWGFTEDKYLAYRLSIGGERQLWGYINIENTSLSKKMNLHVHNIFHPYSRLKGLKPEMIVKIQFPENTNKLNDQYVEIVDVVSVFWLDTRK